MSEKGVKNLLLSFNQSEWTTKTRLHGLLLIIDFITRKQGKEGAGMSGELAHDYVSSIKRRKGKETIREPIAVLMAVRILDRVRPAVFAHIKTPAVYKIAEHLKERLTFEIVLNPTMASKVANAPERKEKRDNRRFPYLAQLSADLEKLNVTEAGSRIIHRLLSNGEKAQSAKIMQDFVFGSREARVKIAPTGQITTNIGSCPREIKPELTLDGEQVALCDISHAHFCFLPIIVSDRIDHLRRHGASNSKVADYEAERESLIDFMSEGDFYRKLCDDPDDDDERERVKSKAIHLLNYKNTIAVHVPIYLRLKMMFPLTFGILENIKANDHRVVSKQLQRFTADAIAAALLKIQKRGFPAIPDVDCIICKGRHRKTVCKAIGAEVYGLSGVRCKVDGERYKPSGKGGVKSLSTMSTSVNAR